MSTCHATGRKHTHKAVRNSLEASSGQQETCRVTMGLRSGQGRSDSIEMGGIGGDRVGIASGLARDLGLSDGTDGLEHTRQHLLAPPSHRRVDQPVDGSLHRSDRSRGGIGRGGGGRGWNGCGSIS
eukprot:1419343-Rhodomonas_salina.1